MISLTTTQHDSIYFNFDKEDAAKVASFELRAGNTICGKFNHRGKSTRLEISIGDVEYGKLSESTDLAQLLISSDDFLHLVELANEFLLTDNIQSPEITEVMIKGRPYDLIAKPIIGGVALAKP